MMEESGYIRVLERQNSLKNIIRNEQPSDS